MSAESRLMYHRCPLGVHWSQASPGSLKPYHRPLPQSGPALSPSIQSYLKNIGYHSFTLIIVVGSIKLLRFLVSSLNVS
ncbi:MAG: hypothetical protein QXU63_05415, partial [Nitrososphaerota archaeon]